MARSSNQKRKILYLMKILMEQTDQDHPFSMDDLIEGLAAYGVTAERKSIYDDLRALELFGLDVQHSRSKPMGYYVGTRTFQTAELKVLMDSVLASQFITEKKTYELLKKLESLCSVFDAQLMRRQVYVSGRIKHMNESIFYSVDSLHSAIAQDRQVGFLYFEYSVEKKRIYRHDGRQYRISPFALLWDNENYYMIGYDEKAQKLKHYRVDRMESIALLELGRQGHEAFRNHDMSVYSRRNFSMYGGPEVYVTIEFENHLVGVVMDRFGKDVILHREKETHFKASASVAVSPQFYAWVFGLGTGARILSPQSVVQGMRDMLDGVDAQYLKP